MIALQVFPAPLLRLVLCGGGGLDPAWGPVLVHDMDGKPSIQALWDPARARILVHGCQRDPFNPGDAAEGWSLPLERSPWEARLATVAAWMLGFGPETRARVYANKDRALYFVASPLLFSSREPSQCTWYAEYGWRPEYLNEWRDNHHPLVTLTGLRLDLHPPAVALLLALYDVPEVRARAESV